MKSHKKTNKNIVIQQIKVKLTETLPALFDHTLNQYNDIMSGEITYEPKLATAKQTAAKMAFTHLEGIIKLAEWAMPEIEQQCNDDDNLKIEKMLNAAKIAIENSSKNNDL